MPWQALHLEVDAPQAEALAEALLALGAQSVSTEDAAEGTPDEAPRYGEPGLAEPQVWPHNRLTALVEIGADGEALVREASRAAGLTHAPCLRTSRVEDDDWVKRTQSQFGPLRIGQLWIAPHWCAAPDDASAVVLRLDPGLAFGTGSHPTTRLVLAWLAATLKGGERVLDYGCGSGILGIAAARLGAAEVTAVDLDAQALRAAAANAGANRIALRVMEPSALSAEPFDVIVANILAGPLVSLAAEFAARAQRGARLALSGILAGQADEVLAAYAPQFELRADAHEEGWQLLTGVRR